MKLMNILYEGVYDPGILKCIFLVGGPGSGKSFVMQQLFGVNDKIKFSRHGLKLITPDPSFEVLLKKNKIDPSDLNKIYNNDKDYYDQTIEPLRMKAKNVSTNIERTFISQKLGIILEGTGKNADSIIRLKALMESNGYDCYMIFVNTNLKVAKIRNNMRSRTLPEEILEKLWYSAQENMGRLQSIFGSNNMLIIDNSNDGNLGSNITKTIDKFMRLPIKNKVGQDWVKHELKRKNKNV